jgi:hypothetical protein
MFERSHWEGRQEDAWANIPGPVPILKVLFTALPTRLLTCLAQGRKQAVRFRAYANADPFN